MGLLFFGIGTLIVNVLGIETDLDALEIIFIGLTAFFVIVGIVLIIVLSVKKRRMKKNEKDEETEL